MFEVTICQDLVRYCEDSHPLEVDAALSKIKYISGLSEACNRRSSLENKEKRSAKKGNSGDSRSSTSSRARAAVSSVRKAGKRLVGSRTRGSSKVGTSGFGTSGVKKKKKKSAIRKYGKYVVAGIAGKRQSMDYSFVHCSIKKILAYGAYKLAKKMSKGLRGQYDDDDCWEYNNYSEQYQCRCNGECQVYVGAAATTAARGALVMVSLIATMCLVRDRNYL